MTKNYIGTKEILAWGQEKDGKPGYAVKYPDGYISWSPKDVFDAAYRASEGDDQALNFGDAIHFLKKGEKLARAGWNGKGMWLEMQRPDENSKMTLPYVYLNYPCDSIHTPGARVPWLASQTDMLAEDWLIVE
ncbi:MAG: DUF2829 domain-containing protein [Bryobacteraceae bacterium]